MDGKCEYCEIPVVSREGLEGFKTYPDYDIRLVHYLDSNEWYANAKYASMRMYHCPKCGRKLD